MSSQEDNATKNEIKSRDEIIDNSNIKIEEPVDDIDNIDEESKPELLIKDEDKELYLNDEQKELEIEDKSKELEIEDQKELEIEDKSKELEIKDKPKELEIKDMPKELEIEDKPKELEIEDKKELKNPSNDSNSADLEEDISKLSKFKKSRNTTNTSNPKNLKRSREESFEEEYKENIDNNEDNIIKNKIDNSEEIEDEQTRKRREFEEKFNALIKKPTKKRRNNDVDLEAMQDEAISHLKNMMKDAAFMDIDCVNNKKPATNKLKLLPQVRDTLLRSNLYDSILDNNLLEAVRIWLEPLPDASLPSFEIQKTLLNELTKMPIKTIHLRESGLGKVMIFYQKSKKVDPALKRIAEKLIGDWTRPVMGRSDNYRAREIPTVDFDIEKFKAKTKLSQSNESNKSVRKSLYQESADRRKRAAAPEARTSVYTIAPQSNINKLHSQRASVLSMGIGASLNRDERFKAINKKLTKLSQKKKQVKKDGVSIEGRGLNI